MKPAQVITQLAPTGSLRAAINLGNPVLAQRDASGALGGVSVDLARALAARLEVELVLIPFDAAGAAFASVKDGACDVAFLAIDPLRATELLFTAPYVIIEGGYLVRNDSPLRTLDEVDRDGVRIAVGRNAAYDLYLSRNLRHATPVRFETSRAAIDSFIAGETDVAAGIRTVLAGEAATRSGFRVLDGAFMTIRQAMATSTGREAAARYLAEFVEEMKASGFVAEALARSGQADAVVAPPAETK